MQQSTKLGVEQAAWQINKTMQAMKFCHLAVLLHHGVGITDVPQCCYWLIVIF